MLVLFLGGACCVALRSQPVGIFVSASAGGETNKQQRVIVDPEMQDTIDTWAKGLPTNGVLCALGFMRPQGSPEALPTLCALNVVNITHVARRFVNLPQLLQIKLFDAGGNAVPISKEGKQFVTWTPKQIDSWFRKLDPTKYHGGGMITVLPMLNNQMYSFSLPKQFLLKQPGEYTLHLRMQLAEVLSGTNNYRLETLWLPEVVTKLHITAEDILPPRSPDNGQTKVPAKHE